MKAFGAVAAVSLLLITLAPGIGGATSGDQAGSEDTGASYRLTPNPPAELDDIVVNVTVWHEWCYSVDTVEVALPEHAVDISILATEGELCVAVDGPFERTLPVHVGPLAAGSYDISVLFEVCDKGLCEATQTGSSFDVAPIGDASCDLEVNSIDANLVLQSAAQLIQRPPCETAGDSNRDGQVQSVDAALILQYTAGLLEQLPPG